MKIFIRKILHPQLFFCKRPPGFRRKHGLQLSAQHMAHQILVGQVLILQNGNHHPVAHDCNSVGDLENLIQPVGNVNNRDTFLLYLADHPEQDIHLVV